MTSNLFPTQPQVTTAKLSSIKPKYRPGIVLRTESRYPPTSRPEKWCKRQVFYFIWKSTWNAVEIEEIKGAVEERYQRVSHHDLTTLII